MRPRLNSMEIAGGLMVLVLVAVALLAPFIAPYDPTRAVANTFGDPGAPSRAFPLGTDQLGRDVLSRIIYGSRVSLAVGVSAMAITMTIGVAIGLLSGFFGGAIDFILMRFTDVMLTLPGLLLAMAFVSVLRPSILSILLVIGIVSWTGVARVVRAEALSVSKREFVIGGRALGAGSTRLILRHVLPNVAPIIVVMAALGTSGTLLLDAGLSFLN
ncbi:MAG TPA: ABC transporter permease, partial [Candidatus Binataceae bacterium]|nr:ABC transporter permease [Candidatus Binataceae bacterium]